MNAHEQTKLASRLINIPVGESSCVVDNGCWQFVVHHYEDCWFVLWDAVMFERCGRQLGRDIGRVFRDDLDFVNFVCGYPQPQFVLEGERLTL